MATRVTKAKGSNGGGSVLEKVHDEAPVKNTKRIEAENTGPIHKFGEDFAFGINELRGGNGVGKSSLQNLIAAAGGAGIPVSVTDGENAAKLIIDGSVVFESARKKGQQPYVSLASVSSVALVVDPGIKNPESAEEARLKNLLKLVKAATTDEMIEYFLTPDRKSEDDEPSVDGEAYDYVDSNYGIDRLKELDPVAVADVLIKGSGGFIHKLKREYRAKADNAQARYQVAKPEKPERLSKLSLDEADAEYRRVVGDHREAQGSWQQRQEREKERAGITLGDRPDPKAARADFEDANEVLRIASHKVIELEKQLALAKAEQHTRTEAAVRAANDLKNVEIAAEQWDRNAAILESEITGASAADVQDKAQKVIEAKAALELARSTDDYHKRLEIADVARKERDAATARESEVERLAAGIPARLGEQFNLLGIPGARVNDGVLEVQNEKGKWEPFYRRSKGQQWDWVLPIDAAQNPGGLVALPKEAWFELEDERKAEVARAFVKHQRIGIVEVSTFHGDPLHVEQYQA